MSNWEHWNDNLDCYMLEYWWNTLQYDDKGFINGFHPDDIQESLYGLMSLLKGLGIIEYVEHSEGEPCIWMRRRKH